MKPFPLLYLPDSPEFWKQMGECFTDETPATPEQIAAAQAIVDSPPVPPRQGTLPLR